jgi:hypothetical protein
MPNLRNVGRESNSLAHLIDVAFGLRKFVKAKVRRKRSKLQRIQLGMAPQRTIVSVAKNLDGTMWEETLECGHVLRMSGPTSGTSARFRKCLRCYNTIRRSLGLSQRGLPLQKGGES